MPANAIKSVGALLGEYRVAGIDGEPLDTDFGIAVSIDGPVLSYEPTCLGFVWNMRFDQAGALFMARDPRFGPEVQPDGSVIPCMTGVPPEYAQLGEAFDAATMVQVTPENGLRFSGGGRSVTLFSQ